jgi:hypothetical protein
MKGWNVLKYAGALKYRVIFPIIYNNRRFPENITALFVSRGYISVIPVAYGMEVYML